VSGLWLLVLAGLSFAIFILLAVTVPDRGGYSWDSPIKKTLDALAPISSEEIHPDPFLTGIVVVFSAAAALFAVRFLLTGRQRAGLFLAGSLVGTVALSSLTKVLVQRPSIEGGKGDYSFPSGTAAWAMAISAAAVLLASTPRARRLAASGGAAFVLAYSAVITWEEWHYPSDILAGWCLALGWVALLARVLGAQRSVAAESGAGPWGRLRPSKSAAGE
jgi:undecaprenyl-diphosphatase